MSKDIDKRWVAARRAEMAPLGPGAEFSMPGDYRQFIGAGAIRARVLLASFAETDFTPPARHSYTLDGLFGKLLDIADADEVKRKGFLLRSTCVQRYERLVRGFVVSDEHERQAAMTVVSGPSVNFACLWVAGINAREGAFRVKFAPYEPSPISVTALPFRRESTLHQSLTIEGVVGLQCAVSGLVSAIRGAAIDPALIERAVPKQAGSGAG